MGIASSCSQEKALQTVTVPYNHNSRSLERCHFSHPIERLSGRATQERPVVCSGRTQQRLAVVARCSGRRRERRSQTGHSAFAAGRLLPSHPLGCTCILPATDRSINFDAPWAKEVESRGRPAFRRDRGSFGGMGDPARRDM